MDIESIILTDSSRGMDSVRTHLEPGYCRRAAELLLGSTGTVLIGTGFPVSGSFETDGPIGAIALYTVLEKLGIQGIFVCAPPISAVLELKYRTSELPICSSEKTEPAVLNILKTFDPYCIISIERPGAAQDGRYYNMKGEDISASTARFDLLLEKAGCPSIGVGDGGNEIGMGNALEALKTLDIEPSVTRCDELVVSTVSNWGVYGIIAEMSRICSQDLLNCFDPLEIVSFLKEQGSLDGVTARPEKTEDGFPVEKGIEIITRLQNCL
jgi:hypothetical protein